MSAAMTPVLAARAFAAGDRDALQHIPLTATDGRCDLVDMDGMWLFPSRSWSGYFVSVWIDAGFLEIDVAGPRFRLTEAGRAVLRSTAA